jgi:site-specific DNA-methyltransferase (adenine-specific)
MTKVKSARNKTIDTSLADGYQYLERCITVNDSVNDIFSILDKTVLGDSLEVLKYLPKESVDLIVVDPPYNLTKKFNKNTFSKKSKSDYESYSRKWLAMVAPILKSNGSIYICCDWETSIIIGNVLGDYFKIQNRITWQREKGRGAKANWKNGMEDIWFATKGDQYTFNLDAVKTRKKVIAPYRVNGKPKDWQETESGNYRETHPSNFWDDITIPFWSMPENTAHPTQKSEKLIAKIILASSNENDIVLDPFLGSGTTSVVAKKLKRRYLGIEIDKQYCLWAEQRLEMADINAEIQGYVDGVFWERNSLAEQIAAKNKTEQKVENKAGLPSEQTFFDLLEMT